MQALEESPDSKLALNLMAVSVVENIEPAGNHGVVDEPTQSGERIRWVPCALEAQDGDSAWETLYSGQFDPNRQVVIEGGAGTSIPGCQRVQTNPDIKMIYEHSNQLELHLQAPSQGWLVLSDVWYPGWQARIDGKVVPILRANYLFRAVRVEAGEHEVNFSYIPLSFYLGSIASLITAVILWLASRVR
jgi:hypothetical protein